MAKLTLDSITSGHAATTLINANNDLVEAAIENTLSLDGTTPNAMQADLDVNSNNIINVADGVNAADAVNVRQLQGQVAAPSGVIPSQTGNANKVLKTDGTVTSWVNVQDIPASFTTTGGITATTLQTAIAEVDSEKMRKDANLSDVTNAATARTNLDVPGLGANNTFTGNNSHAGSEAFNHSISFGNATEVSTSNSAQVVSDDFIYHLASGNVWIWSIDGTGGSANRMKYYGNGGFVGCNTSGTEATGGDKGSGSANFRGVYDDGNRVFSKSSMVESSGLPLTANSTQPFAHGFSSIPKLMMAVLKNTISEYGYALGDEIIAMTHDNVANGTATSGLHADATNVYYTIDQGFVVIDKGTFGMTTATPSSWELILRAWK